VIVSVAVALVIQVLVNLRLEFQTEALRLAPAFLGCRPCRWRWCSASRRRGRLAVPRFPFARAILAIGAYAAICIVVQLLYAKVSRAFGAATLPGVRRVVVFPAGAPAREARVDLRDVLRAIFGIHRNAGTSSWTLLVPPSRARCSSRCGRRRSTILSRGDRLFSSFSNCSLLLKDREGIAMTIRTAWCLCRSSSSSVVSGQSIPNFSGRWWLTREGEDLGT